MTEIDIEKISMTAEEQSWASWKCDGGPHKPSIVNEGYIGHSRPMTNKDKERLGWLAVKPETD